MEFLFARLREPSSWAGLATIAASAAQAWQHRDVGALVGIVAGAAAALIPEKSSAA